MPTIVATAGASNANSFATEAAFIARAATKLSVPAGTTVEGTECTETEQKALIEATGEINRLPFMGSRFTATQALAWPREYARNPDAPWVLVSGNSDLNEYETDVIPDRVVNATIDLALAFIAAGQNTMAAVDANQGVIRKKVDVLETQWASPQSRPQGLARYPDVLRDLNALLISEGGSLNLLRA
jgi:hypothetical protein